ncbi:MAG: excinuclease ABC subunit UvrB [Dehalococcoidia bacterium]|nr:excinuclease ABC subunit UvrB [Dehalococcoidia bacterium]
MNREFAITSELRPTGDQPEAIDGLVDGLQRGFREQTLLGVTGSGKTFTMANIIARVQRPTMVICHNKTLAAQLVAEFQEFFSKNSVGYFVSYYDYYQPEAYIPSTDTYIEKETDINEEIDRLRHAATKSLFERRDVVIVASVSCIYSLGSPEEYHGFAFPVVKGHTVGLRRLIRTLIGMQYERNDIDLTRGRFRVRGDTLEVCPAYEETAIRVEFFGDAVERITELDVVTGELLSELENVDIYPAKHFVTPDEKLQAAMADIRVELGQRLVQLKEEGKLLEAQRLESRTNYDLEMMAEVGYCSGVENYSRHLQRRTPGSTPWTLLDYFPPDYLMFVDESHMTLPQVRGMYHGDLARKQVLIDHGFRLPSALDNRPLRFDEFVERINQVIYVSATPREYELSRSQRVCEQLVRPTGLLEPTVEVRPTMGQIDDLIGEIRRRVAAGERCLVTTLTKRMAEDLSEYLAEMGVKTHHIHAEVDTLERIQILRDLRLGVYDVVVGINLLREGLDLPEVSLVAILDADKEGYLRSAEALIQTIGRAARHVNAHAILYADSVTASMKTAMDEAVRRRAVQEEYNRVHHITPQSVSKAIRDIAQQVQKVSEPLREYGERPATAREMSSLLKQMERDMQQAARALEFEKAALIRDRIAELRKETQGLRVSGSPLRR